MDEQRAGGYRPRPDEFGRAVATVGGQPAPEFADTLVLPWNDIGAVELAFEKYGGEIACAITEPILVNSGSLMPADGYLARLIELCRTHGAVSIFDEVITGFRVASPGGRTGVHGSCARTLSVYAKAMGGGFAISAVGGPGRNVRLYARRPNAYGRYSGTYNGNCIATAAAIATIDVLAVTRHVRSHARSWPGDSIGDGAGLATARSATFR